MTATTQRRTIKPNPNNQTGIFLLATAFMLVPQVATAYRELRCAMNKYGNAGFDRIGIIKTYIPETQKHALTQTNSVRHMEFGLRGKVTENNEKKVKFHYKFLNAGVANVTIKHVFFRSTNKFAVNVSAPGYVDVGPVWGICEEH